MKKVIASLLFVLLPSCTTLPNIQELVAEFENGTATLYNTPCNEESVLQYIMPQARHFFKNGVAEVEGATFKLCWREHATEPDQFFIIDEYMGFGSIESKKFSPKPETKFLKDAI